MTQHTPGPWTQGTSDDGRECVWLNGKTEPEIGMGVDWIDCNTEANARLIAAAPELLALLREARSTLEMWKDVAPAISLCADIDAAIAKAGGAV